MEDTRRHAKRGIGTVCFVFGGIDSKHFLLRYGCVCMMLFVNKHPFVVCPHIIWGDLSLGFLGLKQKVRWMRKLGRDYVGAWN